MFVIFRCCRLAVPNRLFHIFNHPFMHSAEQRRQHVRWELPGRQQREDYEHRRRYVDATKFSLPYGSIFRTRRRPHLVPGGVFQDSLFFVFNRRQMAHRGSRRMCLPSLLLAFLLSATICLGRMQKTLSPCPRRLRQKRLNPQFSSARLLLEAG